MKASNTGKAVFSSSSLLYWQFCFYHSAEILNICQGLILFKNILLGKEDVPGIVISCCDGIRTLEGPKFGDSFPMEVHLAPLYAAF